MVLGISGMNQEINLKAADEWLAQPISLKNKHGLHMRPAQKIVEMAGDFDCEIMAIKDDREFSAKSILDMIEFAEYMVNSTGANDGNFLFRARGADAQQALDSLNQLIEDRFGLE